MEEKIVLPSRPDSHESAFHDSGVPRFLLDMTGLNDDLRETLGEDRVERFIAVIYRRETERASHYAPVRLARQFDAFVWGGETRALTPLGLENDSDGPADTYPFRLQV